LRQYPEPQCRSGEALGRLLVRREPWVHFAVAARRAATSAREMSGRRCAEIVELAEYRPLRAPSLFRQYKHISTQDYRDGRKDNSRCNLHDLFYFWCGLLLA
jgi:hypothetical protein